MKLNNCVSESWKKLRCWILRELLFYGKKYRGTVEVATAWVSCYYPGFGSLPTVLYGITSVLEAHLCSESDSWILLRFLFFRISKIIKQYSLHWKPSTAENEKSKPWCKQHSSAQLTAVLLLLNFSFLSSVYVSFCPR